MASPGEQLRERFLGCLRAVIDGPDTPASARLDALRDASQALLDSHLGLEATVTARDLQIAAHRAVLAHLVFPMLQVRDDTLCVPVFGELNAERSARLAEAVLALVVARGVGNVVFDLSGALLTRDTPLYLVGVFQILDQLGVRGALSGVGPEVADALAHHPEVLRDVRCFVELADALATLAPRPQAVARP